MGLDSKFHFSLELPFRHSWPLSSLWFKSFAGTSWFTSLIIIFIFSLVFSNGFVGNIGSDFGLKNSTIGPCLHRMSWPTYVFLNYLLYFFMCLLIFNFLNNFSLQARTESCIFLSPINISLCRTWKWRWWCFQGVREPTIWSNPIPRWIDSRDRWTGLLPKGLMGWKTWVWGTFSRGLSHVITVSLDCWVEEEVVKKPILKGNSSSLKVTFLDM